MASGADLRCTVEFKSDELVSYSDTMRRSAEEKVDPAGLTWRTIAVLATWVRNHDALIQRKELEVLGSHLYHLLFGGQIGKQFTESYEAFKDQGSPGQVRLELCFHPAAEDLAGLPWEFLYLPGWPGGFFLAGENNGLVLTRLVPRDPAMRPVEVVRRPKVLVAVCHHVPSARSQVEQIEGTISGLSTPEDIEALPPLNDPTFEELSEAVQHDRPHVLHLIAHGEPGGLVMKLPVDPGKALASQARGEPPPPDQEVIDASMLKSMFETHRPHLVLLHACNGDAPRPAATKDDAPSFTMLFTTAREIAYAGVPAVVAMQYPILVDHAMIFVKEFYQALVSGKSVSDATKEGRRKLANTRQVTSGQAATGQVTAVRMNWATRLFGAPVVYAQQDVQLMAEREPMRLPRRDMLAGPAMGVGGSMTRRPEGPKDPPVPVPVPVPAPVQRRRRCSDCGAGNNPSNPVCWRCGASLAICAYCHHAYENPQTDEACHTCGLTLWLDAETGAYPADAGTYPADAGTYPADAGTYPAGGGGGGLMPPGISPDPGPGRPSGPTSGLLPRSATG